MTNEKLIKLQYLFGKNSKEWEDYFNLIKIKSISIISELSFEQRVCVTDLDGEQHIMESYEQFLKEFDSKHPKHRSKKLKRLCK